eukprot:snap_masked-scaffold_40-processed-gene-0.50-mRNA-1 protein AED:1.00 eAED:1.00 QI:0/0/0/0/1/1/2/0/424
MSLYLLFLFLVVLVLCKGGKVEAELTLKDYVVEQEDLLNLLTKRIELSAVGPGFSSREVLNKNSDINAALKLAKFSCYFDDVNKSTEAYKKILDVEESNVPSLFGMSQAYLGSGRSKKAKKYLKALKATNAKIFYADLYLYSSYKQNSNEEFMDFVCSLIEALQKILPEHHLIKCEALFEFLPKTSFLIKKQHSGLQKLLNSFEKQKALYLRDLLPESFVENLLTPYYLKIFQKGRGDSELLDYEQRLSFGDVDIAVKVKRNKKLHRLEVFGDPVSELFNHMLSKQLRRIAGKLIPTYAFPVMYLENGYIHPHVDQSDNEISLSYELWKDEHRCNREPWTLTAIHPKFINEKHSSENGMSEFKLNQTALENAFTVRFKGNDGILYKGKEVIHFREPHKASKLNCHVIQIVFAWRKPGRNKCIGE